MAKQGTITQEYLTQVWIATLIEDAAETYRRVRAPFLDGITDLCTDSVNHPLIYVPFWDRLLPLHKNDKVLVKFVNNNYLFPVLWKPYPIEGTKYVEGQVFDKEGPFVKDSYDIPKTDNPFTPNSITPTSIMRLGERTYWMEDNPKQSDDAVGTLIWNDNMSLTFTKDTITVNNNIKITKDSKDTDSLTWGDDSLAVSITIGKTTIDCKSDSTTINGHLKINT